MGGNSVRMEVGSWSGVVLPDSEHLLRAVGRWRTKYLFSDPNGPGTDGRSYTREYKSMVHASYKFIVNEDVPGSQNNDSTNLKATMMWPLLDTGFAFSRYAVKLSSRQSTSGWVEPTGNDGERGEFGVAWNAVATI